MVWYMFFQEPKASLTSLCDMWRIRCEFCRKFVIPASLKGQPSEPALHPFGAGVYQLKSPVTPDWSPQIWLETWFTSCAQVIPTGSLSGMQTPLTMQGHTGAEVGIANIPWIGIEDYLSNALRKSLISRPRSSAVPISHRL